MRLIDWIVGREPVATATGIAGVIIAALGVAEAWGAPVTPKQIAAVGAFVAALAGWLARRAVTPVPRTPPPARGSIPLALVILLALAVVLMAGLAVCSDAVFEDEDEVNDLGLPALVAGPIELALDTQKVRVPHSELIREPVPEASHGSSIAAPSPTDHDGGSDGNSGGDYEGGRGGSDYDGDGDGNRCRNFCFYGVPAPGEETPRSLFPPTPDGVRAFVVETIRSGVELGRLFAETTIRFVENLLIGIA